MSDTAITMTEKRLTDLEGRIRKGLESFVEVGNALAEIKARNGFMLRGAKTFDEYCSKTFGFSERNGYRLIAAAETAKAVEKAVGEAPRNEASARVLKEVAHDPKLIERVNERLKKAGQTVATATAEKIQEVVDKVKPQTKPMFEQPKEPAKPKLPELRDTCPMCNVTPASYVHGDDGWKCGTCGTAVLVGVIAMDVKACPDCGAALIGSVDFCQNCGVVLEAV
jgi:ribosomal protein S27AE